MLNSHHCTPTTSFEENKDLNFSVGKDFRCSQVTPSILSEKKDSCQNLQNDISQKSEKYLIQIPEYVKNKAFVVENVRKGIFITISDFTLPEDVATSFTMENSLTSFVVILSGSALTTYSNLSKSKKDIEFKPAEFVYRSGDCSGSICIKKNDPFKVVSISLTNEAIVETILEHEQYSKFIDTLKFGEHGFCGLCKRKMTIEAKTAALQIMQCPTDMLGRKLYIEGKMLEILSLQLENLLKPPKKTILNKSDVERIYAAREILFLNMVSPPSIMDLSRSVGINNLKLKQGFREVFDNTVYGILREYRMLKAKELIIKDGATVSTTANLVGYINVSHFITAFKKQFKVTPKEFQNYFRLF